ncbi:MAG: MFS transporter [Candidatus Portiera sp.]|nr:MFS transporter [Portiera sp.]
MFGLFKSIRFTPLFVAQFGGAMNDNVYKNAFAVLLVYVLAPAHNYDAKILVNITQAIFILPYILFAAMAGSLGDTHDKAMIIRRVKFLEIFIVILAIVAFYFESVMMLLFIVFLLSVQSTFFGPVKYSIIPHHIPEHLVNANALITAGTFLAIISGTIVGGYFASIDGGILWLDITLMAIALTGYIAARFVPAAPPVDHMAVAVGDGKESKDGKADQDDAPKFSYNFIAAIGSLMGYIFSRRRILVPLLFGVSWFWFIGSILITQIPIMTGEYLLLEGISVSIFMFMFAFGIGIGAITCSLFMQGKATDRWASIMSIIMGIMILETGFAVSAMQGAIEAGEAGLVLNEGEEYLKISAFFADWRALRLCVDFTLVSIFAGCYVLPIFALLQSQALPKERARVIAANNIMNAVFMVTAAILVTLLYTFGGDIYLVFNLMGMCCILVGILWLIYKRKISPSYT